MKRMGAVVIAYAFIAAATSAPFVKAAVDPPPGTAFLGVFFQVEDIYNYLGYVQQAETGAFRFVNKLALEPHEPALVNLEWWVVGRLTHILGAHPAVVFRMVGLVAMLALVAGLDRLLVLAGLPDSHRLPALLWILTGGGVGGIRYVLFAPPPWKSLDLVTGMFPFIEALANPHFVVGTALLVWVVLAWSGALGKRGFALGAALGWALALSRPYDAVMALAVTATAVVLLDPPRRWLPALAPVLLVVPPLGYMAWVLYANPAFSVFSKVAYTFPPAADLAVALGPAMAAAGAAIVGNVRSWRRETGTAWKGQAILLAWALVGVLLVLTRPLAITGQFLVGIGAPLLGLAAVALSARPAWVTWVAASAFSTTALVAVSIVSAPNPRWHVPRARLTAAEALRGVCARDDVALVPPDIGLFALAVATCKPFVAHVATPDFADREAFARHFYGPADPRVRAQMLDARCVSHVLLPAGGGDVLREWLGNETAFRRVSANDAASVYARALPANCRR